MTERVRRVAATGVIAAAVVLGALSVTARSEWSAWANAAGGDANLEYRWRGGGMCLAAGCGKDVHYQRQASK